MHQQDDLFRPMCARVYARQGELFDQAAAADADSNLRCGVCGRNLVRTDGGYLCCPAGHGRLIHEAAAEVEDDANDGGAADPWDAFAQRVARTHRIRHKHLGWPPCQCGACRHAGK